MNFSHLIDRTFLRDALSLSGGTAIAQVIAITTLPILTRMYTPEEFGVLAIFVAIVSILSIFSSLGIEQSIMLAESEKDAVALLAGLIVSCIFFTIIVQIIIFFYGDTLLEWIGKSNFNIWLYFLPITIFFVGIYQGLRFWQMRQKKFKLISKGLIYSVAVNLFVSILIKQWANDISYLSNYNGLIVGYIMQCVINTFILLKDINIFSFNGMSIKRVSTSIKPHKSLIGTLLLSHGIIATSYGRLPIMAIGSLFNPTILGYYSMVERIISAPATLISNALGDIFRQRASVAWRVNGNFNDIYWKTLLITSIIGIPIYSIGIYFSPSLFKFILGNEWGIAGDYAQIMLYGSMIQFITVPVDKGAVIIGANRFIFIWNLLRLLGVVSIIVIIYIYKMDIYKMILLLTLNNIIAYLSNVWFENKFASGK